MGIFFLRSSQGDQEQHYSHFYQLKFNRKRVPQLRDLDDKLEDANTRDD